LNYEQQFVAYVNQDSDTVLTLSEIQQMNFFPPQLVAMRQDVLDGARKAFDSNHWGGSGTGGAPKGFDAKACESQWFCLAAGVSLAGLAVGVPHVLGTCIPAVMVCATVVGLPGMRAAQSALDAVSGDPVGNGIGPGPGRAIAGRADDLATNTVDDVFHYTRGEFVESISANGLRPGSYATPNGSLSPLQAQIDLALPPNTGLRDAVLRVDVAGLRQAGYEIPGITRVSGTVTGPGGRVYTMPGGGYEMQFPYAIPPEFIKVVTP
jgi:hypothetical protein